MGDGKKGKKNNWEAIVDWPTIVHRRDNSSLQSDATMDGRPDVALIFRRSYGLRICFKNVFSEGILLLNLGHSEREKEENHYPTGSPLPSTDNPLYMADGHLHLADDPFHLAGSPHYLASHLLFLSDRPLQLADGLLVSSTAPFGNLLSNLIQLNKSKDRMPSCASCPPRATPPWPTGRTTTGGPCSRMQSTARAHPGGSRVKN